jgi:hypothetical protein
LSIGNAVIQYARCRHALIVFLAIVLVYLFGLVHGQWSDMHRWNRAAADASFVLLTITMAIGPTAQIWPRLRVLIPFRRELGIYAVTLSPSNAGTEPASTLVSSADRTDPDTADHGFCPFVAIDA